MKHPKYQKNQEEFLKNCPAEEKDFHERFFRIGNAAYVYHQRATSTNDKVQEEYYHEWLEGLPETIRKDMQKKGFEACKTMLHSPGMSTNDQISGWDENSSFQS